MHPTLLVGPADWDAGRMPEEEFRARIEALWNGASVDGAVVYGNPAHHAELAYLTHFTPKLEAALALIPREGAARLLVGGGANMIQAAKPLTFVQDLVPLRNAGKAVAEWLRGLGETPKVVLIGGGAMPPALHREIVEVLALAECFDATRLLHMHMRRKRPRELAAMREACATLDAAIMAMAEAQRSNATATAVILTGERAANRRGAQDVRTLFSLDGGRTLRPFDTLVERAVDPLQVYAAVRHSGYWAEGFAPLTASPHPGIARARDALGAAIAVLQTGVYCRDLVRTVSQAIHPWQPHPMTAHSVGNGIGLLLEEGPLLTSNTVRVGPDEVVSLRVGLGNGRDQCAIVSAMVAVLADGSELLWASPGVAP